jgi:TonB family protein
MGDWYQTRLQHERALPHYKLAWAAAARAPELGGKPLREVLFGRPVLLHYVRPTEWDRYAKRPAGEAVARTVEIDLTVNADGRVRGRTLVSNEGDAHMAEEALEAADTARYRPRFVEGEPVETTDVRMVQTYFEPVEQPESAGTPGSDDAAATAKPGSTSSPTAQPEAPVSTPDAPASEPDAPKSTPSTQPTAPAPTTDEAAATGKAAALPSP